MRRFCKAMPGITKFDKRGICYYSYSSLTCHLGIDICQQSTICPSGSGALRSQTWLRKIDARNCVDIISCQSICPSGSGALRSQTWLRKIDARNCVDIFSYHPLDAISCDDFAKPYLASQSS